MPRPNRLAETPRPNRLAELRRAHGLSQEELGAMIGWGGSTISKWENHKHGIPDSEKVRLAAIFGVSVSHLMMGWDEPKVRNRAA